MLTISAASNGCKHICGVFVKMAPLHSSRSWSPPPTLEDHPSRPEPCHRASSRMFVHSPLAARLYSDPESLVIHLSSDLPPATALRLRNALVRHGLALSYSLPEVVAAGECGAVVVANAVVAERGLRVQDLEQQGVHIASVQQIVALLRHARDEWGHSPKPRPPQASGAHLNRVCSGPQEGVVTATTCAVEARHQEGVQRALAALQQQQSLRQAAAAGKLQEVRLMLRKNPELVNGADEQGRSALWLAAAAGQLEVVAEISKLGGNLDHVDADGASALYAACHRGATEVAQELLELGCNPEVVTQADGASALLVACQGGHLGCVEALIEHGVAHVERPSRRGVTPLFLVRVFATAGLLSSSVCRYGCGRHHKEGTLTSRDCCSSAARMQSMQIRVALHHSWRRVRIATWILRCS